MVNGHEIIATILGFIYLFYEYKADVKMWLFGAIVSLFYVYIFYNSNFFAFAGINIYYFFASLYGWYKWQRKKNEKEFTITNVNKKLIIPIILILIFLIFSIYFLLNKFSDSDNIIGDSIITALSIIAIWGLTKKYIEQWIVIAIANLISVFLFLQQGLYSTFVLYLVFTIVSVLGYFRWKKYYILPKLLKKNNKICCILANGSFPKNKIPLQYLYNSDFLVCCDGAADVLIHKTNKIPDAIIGDCDSISLKNKKRFSDRIFCIEEQETNDLTKAVNFCIDKSKETVFNKNEKLEIIILGATGNREDHTIGNISLLAEYINFNNNIDIKIISDFGKFTAIKKTTKFDCRLGQQISIFNIDNLPISFHNLKYAVNERIFSNWWQGTLNEATSDNFIIETNGRLIVFSEF
jgi:thiamine pyrophosphokinase